MWRVFLAKAATWDCAFVWIGGHGGIEVKLPTSGDWGSAASDANRGNFIAALPPFAIPVKWRRTGTIAHARGSVAFKHVVRNYAGTTCPVIRRSVRSIKAIAVLL
jgi:hypothetical protein